MKKLTAGIFTVMLGLCATSGADAAVASQGYVDTKVGVNTQSITELTQTVADNKSAAETAIADAKKAGTDAAAALETYKTDNNAAVALKANSADVYTKSEVYTKTEADAEFMNSTEVDNAISSAVTGENGALKDYAKVTDLNATNQNVTANTNAISAINDAETGILAVAKKYADDNDADTIYDDTTVKADIAKNAGAIATLNGNDRTEGSVAKSIADAFTEANLSQYATTDAMDTALLSYELKSNLKALAYKDTVGINDIDDLAVTTAKLADGAVESGKIANGAVTDEKISAVASSKVTGLSESLATKMDITNTTTVAGKYVFTANVGENGVTDYAWEEIARD